MTVLSGVLNFNLSETAMNSVLYALATTPLAHDAYLDDRNRGCVAIVAAATVQGINPAVLRQYCPSEDEVPDCSKIDDILCTALGIDEDALQKLIDAWDEADEKERLQIVCGFRGLAGLPAIHDDQFAEQAVLLTKNLTPSPPLLCHASSASAQKEVIQ